MTINDLVTHYVTFRRTLGERCRTNEALLRSFCRLVGPQTPVAGITAAAIDAFLAGGGPVTSTWHTVYSQKVVTCRRPQTLCLQGDIPAIGRAFR